MRIPRAQSTGERGRNGFHTRIRKVAEELGYFVVHWNTTGSIRHRSNKALKGMPDFLLLKPGRAIWVEVKGVKGALSPEQQEWINRLDSAHQEVWAWWPDDYDFAVRLLAAKGDRDG